MQYHDLDVTLANGGLHYQRVARCGTRHGERQDEVPLDLEPLARALETLEAYAGARLDEQAQRDLGMLLYDGLFGRGSVGAQLERCIGGAQMEENGGVRVRLDLDGAPQLARIPWEFLYFPSDERFLAPSLQSPLIRYLRSGAANPGLEVRLPVRVLAVLPESAARGEAPLDLAAEKALLQRAVAPLAAAGTADLRFLDREATPDRLRSALSGGVPELGEEPFQVVCFAGHGEAHAGGARLFLDGEGGEPVPVEDRWLAELFDPARGVKLVVLNACQGATVTGLQPFAGLAPRLVKQGVPAVVAMQFPVYDDEALCFAETFYRALFRGPSRGRVEVATSEARRALKQDFPDSRAWGAPVLYMRAGGYLFTPTTGRTARDVPLGRDEADAWREAVREHERTIGQLSQASPDERTVALLRRERRELSRALRLLRLRGLVAGAVLAVAGALTALPALRFEGRPLEERLEAYSPWLAGVLVPDPLDSRILLASVTERTQQARGRGFDDPPSLAAWRRDHAAVLDALSRGGARVVVFTQFFESATAGDSALAGAIRRAETRGTRVVLGFRDLEDGRPRLVPGIRDAAGAWGALCMVTRPVPTGWVIPLVIFPDGGSDPSTAVSSLAAAAVTAYHGDHLARLEPSRRRLVYAGAGGERSLAYGHVEPGTNSEGCSALGPDGVAFEGILNSSPRRAFAGTRHRLAYEALLGRNAGREAERARGRIVLVGRDNPANTFPVTTIPVLSRGKEHRYAGELQADAINSVLRGTLLRPLSTLVQFLVTAGLGAAAAAAALHGRARRRRGRGLLLLGGIVAGYLASAALVMVWAHVLLNVWFHLLAIVVSFVVARVIRRRYAL